MLPIRKILAPTDFSDLSLQTLGEAAELAAHFQADLLILYVVPPIPTLPPDPSYSFEVPAYQEALHQNAEERLKEIAAEKVPKEVPCQTRVSYGDPAQEIVRIAQEARADLIVIATHGLTGWRHLVFGSVAEKVVRLARCPVLTIRHGTDTD